MEKRDSNLWSFKRKIQLENHMEGNCVCVQDGLLLLPFRHSRSNQHMAHTFNDSSKTDGESLLLTLIIHCYWWLSRFSENPFWWNPPPWHHFYIAGGNNPLFRVPGKTHSLQESWESEFGSVLFWHWTFSLWWGRELKSNSFPLIPLFLLLLLFFVLLLFTYVLPQLWIDKKSSLQAESTVHTSDLSTEGASNGTQAAVMQAHGLQTGSAERVVTVEHSGNAVNARVTQVTDSTFEIFKQHHDERTRFQ